MLEDFGIIGVVDNVWLHVCCIFSLSADMLLFLGVIFEGCCVGCGVDFEV